MTDDAPLSPHDDLFKFVFEQPTHAAPLLREILPADIVGQADWRSLRVESGELRSRKRRLHTDILFSVRLGAREAYIYVLVEHQSSTDHWMAVRVLGYLAAIWQRCRRDAPDETPPIILPVVLHHDERPWSAPVRFHDLFHLDPKLRLTVAPYLPDFQFLLVDLATLDEAALWRWTLTDLARLCLWLLKTARHNPNLAADLQSWLDALRRIAAAPNGVAAVIALFDYASQVGEIDPDQVAHIAKQLGPAVQEEYMTGAERLIERGREKGREEERVEIVLRQLALKFGPLAPDVEARVRRATFDELGRFADRVLTATRIEEIFD